MICHANFCIFVVRFETVVMITFNFQYQFRFVKRTLYRLWIGKMVQSKNKKIGDVNYIFCDDAYLLEINLQYLKHDNYTDIITFDYCEGDVLNGDIFISVERVRENAQQYSVTFQEELVRVMAHGILHLCGYKDKKKAAEWFKKAADKGDKSAQHLLKAFNEGKIK